MSAITLSGLRKTFGSGKDSVRAVDGVDLEIADGEFFSLLGPSGSGKTTVLRLIAGFELPTSGRIRLGDQDVTKLAPFRRDVNTVFQDYALFPHLRVFDNVAYGLRVKGVAKAETVARVNEALETVRLTGFGDRRPAQLSGGQRQRVALARALVNRPRVLLLDEPLGALDLKLREQMQVELKAIQAQVGITFVFVTHDQAEALTMSDRVAVFNGGRVEQVDTPSAIYERPATSFVAGFVGTSNLLPSEIAGGIVGQKATFSVRPEKIRLVAADHEADVEEVVADGVVEEISYAGSTSRVSVVLSSGPTMTVLRQNGPVLDGEPTPVPGSRVRLAWGRRHAVRLPVDDFTKIDD
ncbi:MAG TPA: ABC transporter ATP-binding protein [Kineosporiaceae bacterium]|nr:ABC transporter ATP-binding protein [Kineosporiaceae bacterium]